VSNFSYYFLIFGMIFFRQLFRRKLSEEERFLRKKYTHGPCDEGSGEKQILFWPKNKKCMSCTLVKSILKNLKNLQNLGIARNALHIFSEKHLQMFACSLH